MPSLRAVYRMTMAEYHLRVEGYNRMKMERMAWQRRSWFIGMVGPHLDPKKLPKSEQAWMPMPGYDQKKSSDMSPQMRERWQKAVADYNEKKAQDGRADD